MFTIEMSVDNGTAVAITSLDLSGEHDDVVITIYDDAVYIKQYDDEWGLSQIIIMSPQQWNDIVYSMNLPEGAYIRSKGIDE